MPAGNAIQPGQAVGVDKRPRQRIDRVGLRAVVLVAEAQIECQPMDGPLILGEHAKIGSDLDFAGEDRRRVLRQRDGHARPERVGVWRRATIGGGHARETLFGRHPDLEVVRSGDVRHREALLERPLPAVGLTRAVAIERKGQGGVFVESVGRNAGTCMGEGVLP